MSSPEIYATFARSIASAFATLADAIIAEALAADEVLVANETGDPLEDATLGSRQRQIIGVLEDVEEDKGLKTSEISKAMGGYDQPNLYIALQALAGRGIVERVPESQPHRYRLASKFRRNADPYLEAASKVGLGEWTTYGDVSIAVRGDTRAARAVGRAAARLAQFPTPHRVLLEGGRIPDGWRDGKGNGPEECRRRLEAEGVEFKVGRADPGRAVRWDELRARVGGDRPG